MAGSTTTASLNGAPTAGNLGAVQLHYEDDGSVRGVAAPASLVRTSGYMTDTVPFSLSPTVSDPSKWSADGVQG